MGNLVETNIKVELFEAGLYWAWCWLGLQQYVLKATETLDVIYHSSSGWPNIYHSRIRRTNSFQFKIDQLAIEVESPRSCFLRRHQEFSSLLDEINPAVMSQLRKRTV